MLYHLRPYHKLMAKRLGVGIKPSTKGNYKIDVFDKDGEYITSIGDKRYKDFVVYAEEDGYEVAERRRDLYHKRHRKDSQAPNSRGFYSANILW